MTNYAIPCTDLMFEPSRKGNSVADFIDATGDCWEWTGAKSGNGYGSVRRGGKSGGAHRYVYEALVGPVPDGFDLDHLCRNRSCVNPDHLDPVSRSENLRRGVPGRYKSRRSHCYSGHEMTDENTLTASNGDRRCRICRNASKRHSYREWKNNG